MKSTISERSLPKGRILTVLAVILYIFLLFPSLIIVPMSFGNRGELVFPPASYSLDLYRDYFGSADWLAVTYRSAIYALMASVLALAVGVPAAYGLTRTNFTGKRLLVMLILSPMMVPSVVIALGLYVYYLRIGLNNTPLGVVFAFAMMITPYVVLTTSAGIETLDEHLEKMAVVMGATQWRTFWQVVLPQLVPSLISAGLFAFLLSFDELVVSYFITGPSTMTLPVKMYSSIKWEISPVLAVIATLLTALSSFICIATAVLKWTDAK